VNQQLQPYEQIQAQAVQAMWLQYVIGGLLAIGMIAGGVAQVLDAAMQAYREYKGA
jgi:hypothetical protein